jgi:hypothetical protein
LSAAHSTSDIAQFSLIASMGNFTVSCSAAIKQVDGEVPTWGSGGETNTPAATHHNAKGLNDPGGCICNAHFGADTMVGLRKSKQFFPTEYFC